MGSSSASAHTRKLSQVLLFQLVLYWWQMFGPGSLLLIHVVPFSLSVKCNCFFCKPFPQLWFTHSLHLPSLVVKFVCQKEYNKRVQMFHECCGCCGEYFSHNDGIVKVMFSNGPELYVVRAVRRKKSSESNFTACFT